MPRISAGWTAALMIGLAGCRHVAPTPPAAGAAPLATAESNAAAPGRTSSEDLAPLPVPANAPIQRGKATYYGDRFAGRHTANGDVYDPNALTAAHRTLPFGAIVDVARTDGRHVQVRINDRGPFGRRDRIIDLSKRAAHELGIGGIADVTLRVVQVPRRADSDGKRHAPRRTAPKRSASAL